jgi:hypothetical protein
MRLPRVRFTVRRLMVAVAIVAVILAGILELPGILKRRSELLGSARHWRWRESNLRRAAGVLRSCPDGPGAIRGGWDGPCRSCPGATMGLKPEFAATHEKAARSLLQAANILGRLARRCELGASTPWAPMPPPPPSELAAMKALLDGDGPLLRKYFDVL